MSIGARSALPLLAAALCACGDGGSASRAATPASTATIADGPRRLLGWLGARSTPCTLAIDLEDEEGDPRSPGGVTLVDCDADGPLAKAGARMGDVVVRAAEHWVPLKEDPTLDLVTLVEQEVSAGRETIAITVWRGGELVELSIPVDRPALEVGLPVEVERFRTGARAALDRLVATQEEHGGWAADTAAVELVLDALAALALRSGGAAPEEDEEDAQAARPRALERASGRIEALLADDSVEHSPLGLALAAAHLAEELGPLPAEVVLGGKPRVTASSGAMPPGGPEGWSRRGGVQVMTLSAGEVPEDLLEQLQSGEGEMQVMSFSSSGGELPEGFELPEGVELPEGAMLQLGGPPGRAMGGHAPSAAAPGDGPDLAALLAQHDPDRPAALEEIDAVLQSLLALQAEDGGWGATEDAEVDRLVQTALTLGALGAAQRVGLELEDEPVERAAVFLRGLAHEGKVASAVARGADRRDESGRAASVAAAFLALGCPDTDPFVRTLVEYSDEVGRTLVAGSTAVPFHLLATAVVRRQRGLMTWQRFYDEFRIPLVAAQGVDGAFDFATGDDQSALVARHGGATFDTALGALLLGLQEERLPVMLGAAENPFAPALDGEGRRSGGDEAEEPPEGLEGMDAAPGQVTTIDDPEKARELLESLGIEGELEIQGEGGDGED